MLAFLDHSCSFKSIAAQVVVSKFDHRSSSLTQLSCPREEGHGGKGDSLEFVNGRLKSGMIARRGLNSITSFCDERGRV